MRLLALLAVIVFLACDPAPTTPPESTSALMPTSTPTPSPPPTTVPTPTPTPPKPIAELSITDLFALRDANATRFDDTYRGRFVHIEGVVYSIDDSTVTMDVGYRLGTGFLYDLSRSEQSSTTRGEKFAAVCKVGDYSSKGSRRGTMPFTECYQVGCVLSRDPMLSEYYTDLEETGNPLDIPGLESMDDFDSLLEWTDPFTGEEWTPEDWSGENWTDGWAEILATAEAYS